MAAEGEPRAISEVAGVCELCDRETSRLTKWLDPDGTEHHVCWSCLQRREKRVNLSRAWKRERRGGIK
jgi:ribosome-binding protein aMBF1 (putative translation factor)